MNPKKNAEAMVASSNLLFSSLGAKSNGASSILSDKQIMRGIYGTEIPIDEVLVVGARVFCSCSVNEDDEVRMLKNPKSLVLLSNDVIEKIQSDRKKELTSMYGLGGIVAMQRKKNLNHKDTKFDSVFRVCGSTDVTDSVCEPTIYRNEWQDYDKRAFVIEDGEIKYGLSKENAYMICSYGGGYIYASEDGQRLQDIEDSIIERMMITVASQRFLEFLSDYEGASQDKWKFAQDLGDGVITVAFGVVIFDGEDYPLGKAVYDKYMAMASKNTPLTLKEAHDLTNEYMESNYYPEVVKKAKENGWNLSQNKFDALVDMAWNLGTGSLDYKAAALIATGDLSNNTVLKQLHKELLETATFTQNGTKVWGKNLVERRLDVIKIAQGGADAYTRNEFSKDNWNNNGKDILKSHGLDEATINKYTIQQVE